MSQRSEESTEEPTDRPIADWADFERRPLLKSLGVGAGLLLGTGIGAGAKHDGQDGGGEGTQQLDPVYGFATPDAAEIPVGLEPDHEVDMLAAPPDPEAGRPPFLLFDPVGLRVTSGDIVQFNSVTPDHSVTAIHSAIFGDGRVPDRVPPFSSPILGVGGAWLYRFEEEGVYDIYCGPHFILGMVMRLVVGDTAEEDLPEYAQSVENLPTQEEFSQELNALSEENEDCVWPFLMPADVLGADPLDPMNIQEQGEVPFSAVAEGLGYEYQPPEQQPPGGNGSSGSEGTADENGSNGDEMNGSNG